MIESIIQMLSTSDFYGQSKLIDIAKGKHKIQSTIKGGIKQIKRQDVWQLKK